MAVINEELRTNRLEQAACRNDTRDAAVEHVISLAPTQQTYQTVRQIITL